MAKLEKFKKSLSTKANAPSSESGDTYKEDLSDWATARLTFAPEPGKVNLYLSLPCVDLGFPFFGRILNYQFIFLIMIFWWYTLIYETATVKYRTGKWV